MATLHIQQKVFKQFNSLNCNFQQITWVITDPEVHADPKIHCTTLYHTLLNISEAVFRYSKVRLDYLLGFLVDKVLNQCFLTLVLETPSTL